MRLVFTGAYVIRHFWERSPFFQALPQVQCPVLVLGGEEDPMTPIECQADIVAALPASGSFRALSGLWAHRAR